MAQDSDEFKIKGAASPPSSRGSTSATPPEHQPDTASDVKSDTAPKAEEVKSNASDSGDKQEVTQSAEDLAKYRWYQADAEGGYKYYFHADTQEQSWYPPNEPYWIWDTVNQRIDPIGLQQSAPPPSREEALGSNKAETYTGYNPKVHGNYDPNADYAQYHNQKRAEEAAATSDPFAMPQAGAPGTAIYESTMTLNRFTGNAQAADLDPGRHSDFAKSGRQMNAFFDVDAAANAHGGQSLKEERQNKKLSKDEIKAFRHARKEKKRKKQMAFLTS